MGATCLDLHVVPGYRPAVFDDIPITEGTEIAVDQFVEHVIPMKQHAAGVRR